MLFSLCFLVLSCYLLLWFDTPQREKNHKQIQGVFFTKNEMKKLSSCIYYYVQPIQGGQIKFTGLKKIVKTHFVNLKYLFLDSISLLG